MRHHFFQRPSNLMHMIIYADAAAALVGAPPPERSGHSGNVGDRFPIGHESFFLAVLRVA